MSTFDERENAFEAKFAHDSEMLFKAEAKRNRIVGLWAAEILGKDDAESYVAEVVRSDFQEAGDEDVFAKLKADLGHLVDDKAIREKLDSALSEAKAELAG